MDFRILAVVLVVFFCFATVLFIFLDRKVDTKVKLSFLLLSLGIGLWQLFDVLSDRKLANELLINRLVFVFPALALLGFLTFTQTLDLKKSRKKKSYFIDYFLAVAILLVVLSKYVVRGIIPEYNSSKALVGNNIVSGPLYPVFVILITLISIVAISRLLRHYLRAEPKEKKKIKFIFYGFATAVILALITNVILPTALHNSSYSTFGVLSGLIFIGSFAYSVTRYQFLDIRLAITRSVGYILSLGLFIASYSLLAYLITVFIAHSRLHALQGVVTIVVITVLAVLFAPTKRRFDKLTNFIFFRDAYDPQDFLDKFNNSLVGKIDLLSLLEDASQIIQANLKTSTCIFLLKDENVEGLLRVVGRDLGGKLNNNQDYIMSNFKLIDTLYSKTPGQTTITDFLTDQPANVSELLSNLDIAIIQGINASSNRMSNTGYLLIGHRNSGGVFNKQDMRVLNIISNELAIAIQNALRFEEIQSFNRTLQLRIDDATKKLRHSNVKLRELDETKDDFISMASHQLRTPLTSVKGYISMVLEGDVGKLNHMQREMLGQAFFSSQRMVFLIADLLNVSRLKSGKFMIEPTKVDLSTLVQQEIGQLEETANARSLTLTYDKPSDFPELMLDETKIRQVIMNFVDNAIYYTPAGGHITVRLLDRPSAVELRVEDDGIGVAKADQPHLFTKFYRAGNARKARPDGTGLGLFMAKKVIIAQGGSLVFESQEGKGSTFGFIFSKSKLAIQAHPPHEAGENTPLPEAVQSK